MEIKQYYIVTVCVWRNCGWRFSESEICETLEIAKQIEKQFQFKYEEVKYQTTTETRYGLRDVSSDRVFALGECIVFSDGVDMPDSVKARVSKYENKHIKIVEGSYTVTNTVAITADGRIDSSK